MTPDLWDLKHLTPDIWNLTPVMWYMKHTTVSKGFFLKCLAIFLRHRRMLTKSMKLIPWSHSSLNICYLFLFEQRQIYNNPKFRSFWYFLKCFFLHKEGSRSVRLPFRVGHHVCPGHLWVTPSHPSLTFDRDIDIQSF